MRRPQEISEISLYFDVDIPGSTKKRQPIFQVSPCSLQHVRGIAMIASMMRSFRSLYPLTGVWYSQGYIHDPIEKKNLNVVMSGDRGRPSYCILSADSSAQRFLDSEQCSLGEWRCGIIYYFSISRELFIKIVNGSFTMKCNRKYYVNIIACALLFNETRHNELH